MFAGVTIVVIQVSHEMAKSYLSQVLLDWFLLVNVILSRCFVQFREMGNIRIGFIKKVVTQLA